MCPTQTLLLDAAHGVCQTGTGCLEGSHQDQLVGLWGPAFGLCLGVVQQGINHMASQMLVQPAVVLADAQHGRHIPFPQPACGYRPAVPI